jgi:hypothetical protein
MPPGCAASKAKGLLPEHLHRRIILLRPRRGGMGIQFVTINELGNEVSEDIEVPAHAGATNNEWNSSPVEVTRFRGQFSVLVSN